jgi:hypothetical protein
MVDHSAVSDLKRLQEFRDILVAERRRIIKTVFDLRETNKDTSPTGGANRAPDVQKIQEQIDAVDRAIADEIAAAK